METEVKPPNFVSNGEVFLVRCPECEMENHAMYVAKGICAWCGFDGNSLIDKPKTNGTEEGNS